VGIAVRDLGAAKKTFVDGLGFGGFEAGHLPNGIDNLNYYFEDGTYLETLTAWDAQKAAWLASFTAQREGPTFFALVTSSLDDTTAFLKARGIETGPQIPGTISTAHDGPGGAPKEMWRTMFLKSGVLPADPLFFIGYSQPARSTHLGKLEEARRSGRIYHHPNGALGIKAVWLAVNDLDAAVRAFASVGLPASDTLTLPQLVATGRAIAAGPGKRILLLTPVDEGPLAAHLRAHGPSLCGLSIQVTRLAATRRLISNRSGSPVAEIAGPSGRAVLIEPAVAHGAWLELFEQ
jgi:hypothetical protein